MLDQFLAHPAHDSQDDRGAFQLAWRPVGARPLSAALVTADGWAYPVLDGIPVLLADDAIAVS